MYSTEFVRKRDRKEKSHRLVLGKRQKKKKYAGAEIQRREKMIEKEKKGRTGLILLSTL